MGDFTKLAVWKKSHEVTRGIYQETSRWPRHELFGLTSASELAYYLILAHDPSYMDRPECDALQSGVTEVRRMLASLKRVAATAAETAIPTARLHRKRGPPAAV